LNGQRVPRVISPPSWWGSPRPSAHAVLPRLLSGRAEQLPTSNSSCARWFSAVQIEALMSGEIDLGDGKATVEAARHRVAAAAARATRRRVARCSPAGGADPAADPQRPRCQDVVMYSPVQARYFNELPDQHLHHRGRTPHYVSSSRRCTRCWCWCAPCIGIALVPASAATAASRRGGVRSIGAFRERPVELDAAWRGDSTKTGTVARAARRPAATGVDHRCATRRRDCLDDLVG